jgi:hypothetical protein
MFWQDQNKHVLDWLLEKSNRAMRYLTLRDLLNRQPDDQEFCIARVEAHTKGVIANILAEMEDGGY